METPQDFKNLMENFKFNLKGLTNEMIDRELGLFELSIAVSSLGEEKLTKAHEDTESFKKESWKKAEELAKKSGESPLTEHKRLVNFI